MLPFTFLSLEVVVACTEDLLVAHLEEVAGDSVVDFSLNHKVRVMRTVWMLLLLTFLKIRLFWWDYRTFRKVVDQI